MISFQVPSACRRRTSIALELKLDCLSGAIDRRAIKVGIEQSYIVNPGNPKHPALKFRVRLNEPGDHLANAARGRSAFRRKA